MPQHKTPKPKSPILAKADKQKTPKLDQVTKKIQKNPPKKQTKSPISPNKQKQNNPKIQETLFQKKDSYDYSHLPIQAFKDKETEEDISPKIEQKQEKKSDLWGRLAQLKVLIGCFIVDGNQRFVYDIDKNVGAELESRGIGSCEITGDFNQFTNILNDYDIVWIISSGVQRQPKQIKKFMASIDKFMKAKKPLFLWGQNQPQNTETNLILEKYFNGMKVTDSSSFKGKKQEQLKEDLIDKNHPMASGVHSICEGTGVSYTNNIHSDFEVFASNNNGNPQITYAEANQKHGRILVDGSQLKLLSKYWKTLVSHQYIFNATVWLANLGL